MIRADFIQVKTHSYQDQFSNTITSFPYGPLSNRGRVGNQRKRSWAEASYLATVRHFFFAIDMSVARKLRPSVTPPKKSSRDQSKGLCSKRKKKETDILIVHETV